MEIVLRQRIRRKSEIISSNQETTVEDARLLKAHGKIKTVALKQKTVKLCHELFDYNVDRYEFEECPYNLSEILRAMDTESYMAQAFAKHIFQIYKNGYKFVSKNQEAVSYIRERFHQIAKVTDIPTELLFQEMAQQIVPYSNVFIAKVRNEKASGGRPIEKSAGGQDLEPVAGYFVLDAASMQIKRDKNRDYVKKYRERNRDTGKKKDYLPDNIIHIYYDRNPGYAFGTPYAWSVLDDIRALRRLEQTIEMLMFQHLFPLYHYKIGTDKHPDDPTGVETENVRSEIMRMPTEGMIVSSFRHEIKAIGAEGRAIRAEGYLKHFKQRVISGLGISGIDIGEGDTATRNTADSMRNSVLDRVRSFQKTLKIFIDNFMIRELLLEGGFEWNEDNKVELEFIDVDLDYTMKKENHIMAKWENNMITHDDAMIEMGKEPMTSEEWDKTYWNLIRRPMAIINAVDEPGTDSSKEMTAAATARLKAQANGDKNAKEEAKGTQKFAGKPSNLTKTSVKNQPVNQYGQKGSSKKSLKDGQVMDNINVEQYPSQTLSPKALGIPDLQVELIGMYEMAKSDIGNEIIRHIQRRRDTIDYEAVSKPIFLISNDLKRISGDYIDVAFYTGEDYIYQLLEKEYSPVPERISYIDEVKVIANKSIDKFIDATIDKVKELLSIEDRDKLFSEIYPTLSTIDYRLRFNARTILAKSFNYGIIVTMRYNGIKDAEIFINPDCILCREKANTFSIENATAEDVMPWHPNSSTTIRPKIRR